ncbi:hypothetical protein JW805_09750 [Roseomonas aeriglobus]|nr:hypothetical protein [Roseomonas aeriglobus]
MIDWYDWPGGREAMIRLGPDHGPVVIVALPLFEEANRTRTFAVTMMRALAECGVASVLPDLPGTGESLVALQDVTLTTMREAHEALTLSFDAAGRRTYAVGIRSGALLDPFSLNFGRWHLAPQSGEDVLRELVRIKNAEAGGTARYDRHTIIGADEDPIRIGGQSLSSDLLADLPGALIFAGAGVAQRTVRLDSDPAPADRKVAGAPLWRRAEPGNDIALAEALAEDIAQWVRTCAG